MYSFECRHFIKITTLTIIFIITTLPAGVINISEVNQLPHDPRALYLDLMKKCLANTIYEDGSIQPGTPSRYDPKNREYGLDWPTIAHTMIGMKRLDNLQYCVESILNDNIPGDLIETGVWRGGATIFMRAILKAYNDTKRTVWVADSFEGLPPVNTTKYPADTGWNLNQYSELSVSLDQVKKNFSRYGLLDNQVIFLKGYFSQTLPEAPITSLAVLRLDGDLYESTMDALINLYPKLSVGGYIIIDDYFAVPPSAQAVTDYRDANSITDPIVSIDSAGVFWRKSFYHH